MDDSSVIAYFSMEIGLESEMPTYSGGLGVLAGDTIRSAADLKIPMVAVSLLYRKGYFYQRIDSTGFQREEPVEWAINDYLEELPHRVSVTLEGRTVFIKSWKYEVKGISGFTVPVYFLDTCLPENSEWDRSITDYLYGGDMHYRLCQETVLGIGGVRMLRALGYEHIERFHMNEGHSSLLTLELLDEEVMKSGRKTITHEDIERVRKKCVFTTHTPVRAGLDQFPLDLVNRVLGRREVYEMQEIFCCEGVLNMTYLALNLSHYINGVAKKHGEVAQHMFAGYKIEAITNGIHTVTWVSIPLKGLLDRYIPGWRLDNFSLRYALSIPGEEIWNAHMTAKRKLIEYVNHETNTGMDKDIFTIGFARRATAYKRGDLLFHDVERLKKISSLYKFQVIYGGKAHPRDEGGKEIIRHIYKAMDLLKGYVKVAYLENYDIDLAKLMTAGVDIWLNTPLPPFEASGTSGMKAAVNGVPSFSILDGWWIEGHIEGITGWSIGENRSSGDKDDNSDRDAACLYDKLEHTILPLFYNRRERFIDVMRHSIALNGSFFNTHRMMQQYVMNAYFL